MSAPYLEFRACEAGFVASAIPVWVSTILCEYNVWANDAALTLWRATEPEELYSRELLANVPEQILLAAKQLAERMRSGEIVNNDWTIFPKGEAITISTTMRAIVMPSGELAILHQAVGLANATAAVQRSMTMIRHTSTISAFVDGRGELLSRNAAAIFSFGERPWLEWFGDRQAALDLVEEALRTKERQQRRLRVGTLDEPRWHRVLVNPLRDPVTSELALLVEHYDETEGVEARELASERKQDIDRLSAALTLVEQQRAEILSLSAPILDVGDATLTVPLIGNFDDERSEALTCALLDAVAARSVRRVILDLTGLSQVDLALVGRVEALVRCLKLLGAQPVITGVRPELARAFTREGVTLEQVPTLRSLAAGLRRS